MTIRDSTGQDWPLIAVVEELRRLDRDGSRTAQVIRETYDQLYDGGRSGRYRWDQLFKTEKTHFGTLIEINMQREFQFADGEKLDYCIVGHEVDAKYSQRMWGWMLPPEALGELCLVLTASDERSSYSIGVVRATADALTFGTNRDAKRTLSKAGHDAVVWVHRDESIPPNVLLHMDPEDVVAVFAEKSGQRRVTELFRRAEGRLVNRSSVETVARQLDPMKRIRGNGGARQYLAREGMAIFCGTYSWQRDAAAQLGLPTPSKSEFVSAYLRRVDVDDHVKPAVVLGDALWTVATSTTASPLPDGTYRAPKAPGVVRQGDDGVVA